MSGDLQSMRQRAAAAESLRPQSRGLPERFARRVEEARRRQEAAAEAARQMALQAQEIEAQRRRDKLLQQFEQQNAAQRSINAAGAAADDYAYTSKLNKQDDKAQRKRDLLQDRFDRAKARQQSFEQEARDSRQFDFSQRENATKFQNALQQDAIQQGYTLQRDRMQNDATRERDAAQFGYSTLQENQQARNTLQRDALQAVQQRQRDLLQNQFATQEDARQQDFTLRRDMMQNEFATAEDQRQQQYNQQNMYQREAADISARWQEQVAAARNAGLDFSDRQRKEMQELDASFRKNVLNGPYDEGLKQQAMVEHQKKLASIIPEQRVSSPDEEISQQFFKHPELGLLKRNRDSQGFADWEPLGIGGPDDKQMQMEQKRTEQQQQKMQDALFEREDRFAELVDKLSTQADPETGKPVYTQQQVMEEAKKRFAPFEQHYRSVYGLPPLAPYQSEADAMRSQMPNPQQSGIPGQLPAGGGMADSLRLRSGDLGSPSRTFIPGMMSDKPIPKEIVDKVSQFKGADQIVKLRDSAMSTSVFDQSIRFAADIVLHALMTGDKSDPDLMESMQILRKAGVDVIGSQQTSDW